jgi:hypothetical protein
VLFAFTCGEPVDRWFVGKLVIHGVVNYRAASHGLIPVWPIHVLRPQRKGPVIVTVNI